MLAVLLSRALPDSCISLTTTGPAIQSLAGGSWRTTSRAVTCTASEMARKWLRRRLSTGVTAY
jgi:hypothetical protein